jgi:ABC-type transport system involved in cytochrome bd biosynthesis fused ATPase/permease subunit
MPKKWSLCGGKHWAIVGGTACATVQTFASFTSENSDNGTMSAPRWRIRCIKAKGFKVWGDPTEFDINSPHLVGITGPNGSGKSCLLEALLAASGAAAAAMRVRHLKDLTHASATENTTGQVSDAQAQGAELLPPSALPL